MEAGSDGARWKYSGIAAIVIALLVLGYWGLSGASMVTQYQVATVEVNTDEFGDQIETTVMADEFQFGLLPDKGYDGALPLGGGFLALGVGLLFLGRRRKKGAVES